MRVAKLTVHSDKIKVDNDFNYTLESAQEYVDGYIEMSTIHDFGDGRTIDVVMNEEGKLVDLPPAMLITRNNEVIEYFAGNLLFVTTDLRTGDSIDLSDDSIKWIQDKLKMQHVNLGSEIKQMPVLDVT